MDLFLIRTIFVLVLSSACYFLHPLGFSAWIAAFAGAAAALLAIVVEVRTRALNLRKLTGAAAGGLIGILGAFLFCLVLRNCLPGSNALNALQLFVLLFLTYVGFLQGASKGELLKFPIAGDPAKSAVKCIKILDTSAIIDGRISDITDTGFFEGPLVIPEFVLRELQMVADSSDPSKRQRGRRGLDILERMQANPTMAVQIVEDDFPRIREVDLKLIELAKQLNAKIVTTDFNLNKVAHLHHVPVLNINDLANSLRPIVLPGEKMNITILKEGKEYNQGVGYLDDGTMVVVDHARRMIGRSVEINVTSVLQTASGKMIFGKLEEVPQRPEAVRSIVEEVREVSS